MRTSPLCTVVLLVLFSTFSTCLPAAAKKATTNSPEEKMSPSGRLASRVRQALKKAGVKAAASARSAAGGEEGNCINSADDCEDGFSEGPAGGQAETSIAVDKSGKHIVVGFNDTRGFNNTPVSLSGFMYSDDGGVTFV
jgi:hypothetical protein